jgi:hypothetical protein
LSRNTPFGSLLKKRQQYLFSIVCAGVLMCAGLIANAAPALADTFSHLPTIDLYPTVNFATGNDEYGSPGGPDPCNNYLLPGACPNGLGALTGGNGITSPSAGNAAGGTRPGKLDLNAVISIPLVKGLAFQYEHDRAAGIDTTIGRVTGGVAVGGHNYDTHTYIYPGTSNDIVDTFRLSYTGIKGVGVTVGTFYRFRHDNQATNDPLNLAPADWHEQFLTLNYTAPPIKALNGFTLGASGTYEHNKHHVSAAGLAAEEAAGFSDSDGKTRTGVNYGVNGNLPINKSFSIFGSSSYGAFDFFDNAPVPFYYVIDDVGISKKLNQVLSLTADLNNLTQENRGGWPFAYPNTIHRIYFAIALDIHLAP